MMSPNQVQPRSRNRINNTGMGIPNNHNNTQPTLPSSPLPIDFLISFMLLPTFPARAVCVGVFDVENLALPCPARHGVKPCH